MKTRNSSGGIALVTAVLIGAASAYSQVVTVQQIPGYHAELGEINIAPVVGAGYGPAALLDKGFQSFCVSRDVGIAIPGIYSGFLNTNGVYQPDELTITKGTAWLYSQFATGSLLGYHYAGAGIVDSGHTLSQRAEDAYTLQLAFWTLEGQYWYGTGPGTLSLVEDLGNPWLARVAEVFGGGPGGLLTAMGANTPGGYNVGILNLNEINLTDGIGTTVQPALVLIVPPTPPPPPPPSPSTNKVVRGDSAVMGFWHLKKGVQLIILMPNAPALGNWLAGTFPCLYGADSPNNLGGKSDIAVGYLFRAYYNNRDSKVDAQMLSTALACYVTSSQLAGTTRASKYGFIVSREGLSSRVYNVGNRGTAIGLSNFTDYTVLELLRQANAMKCAGRFNSAAFNGVFEDINKAGGVF